jgi:hypothetical protein
MIVMVKIENWLTIMFIVYEERRKSPLPKLSKING